ncbi:hypothetical protein A1OE_619 [Candidatus Endolissoclinum faulkneri L2]|uniref:Uncharacterized protein n=1 Tax=Candidatus Endolissoclinum faulkneri L2 TaxID=1193729 RepID=K7YMR5_9PROT|nr:hypothetical protein A1OE_619 [Candidatus Endolissoclinum faulkneri L2]
MLLKYYCALNTIFFNNKLKNNSFGENYFSLLLKRKLS